MRLHSHVGSLDDLHLPAVCARVDTRDGYPALAQVDAARAVVMELLRTTSRFDVEVVAYCVMPDHFVSLFAGRIQNADQRGALRRWKQVSGSAHRERTGRTLWQPRCAEWLINDVPNLWEVAAYLVLEPVRRRMVTFGRGLSLAERSSIGAHAPRQPRPRPARAGMVARRGIRRAYRRTP